MTTEDKKKLKSKLGTGKLVDLKINPYTNEIIMTDLKNSDFDGIGRQISESFENIKDTNSKAIEILGKFFNESNVIYRYLNCLDGFAETKEASSWTNIYHSTANNKDVYDCSFNYILALKPGYNDIFDKIIDNFTLIQE